MITHTIPAPLEHTIRLLYPFWLHTGPLDKTVDALCQLRHLGQQQTPNKTWREPLKIHALYQEEILPPVTQVLFGFRHGTNRYLRIDDETLTIWFPQDGQMTAQAADTIGQDSHYPIKPAGEGIELFLSPLGVGVLSLTFDIRLGELKYLPACNHRLSQLRAPAAERYAVPLAATDGANSPDPQAAFEQRLGARGGTFALAELVDFLLAPLKPTAIGLPEPQRQFSVYSVTRFVQHTLFTDADSQTQLKPLLAALAHVEAASDCGSLEVHERVLNPRHWAAVGSLGAAHWVADQEAHSLYSYFVPYLSAMLQRLSLQRLLWEADQAILETDGGLRKLRHDMLRFSVHGCFSEISSREVHNQYYELAQHGLRVGAALQLVQRVLHDMEAAATAAFQQESSRDTQALAQEVGSHVELLADVRRKTEWLVVFFVAFYAVTLVHYLGGGLFTEAYVHCSEAVAPLLSVLIAILLMKPPANPEPNPSDISTNIDKTAQKRDYRALLGLGIISLLVAVWMFVGYQYFLSEKHAINGQSFLCASEGDCGRESAEGTI